MARAVAVRVRGHSAGRRLLAARPRPRLQRRLDRVLPDRALPRRSGGDAPVPGPVPVQGSGQRARHRPRLPPRRARGADAGRDRAIRLRARRAGGRVSHLQDRAARSAIWARRWHCPQGEVERMARLADSWGADRARAGGGAARPAGCPPLEGVLVPDGGDQRPAPPPLPALGRHGDLDHTAGGAGAGDPGRHAGPPDLPVGQGLVRRRRLPQDRPARPGHALGGGGVRRSDRAVAGCADRSQPGRVRRSRRVRRDPRRPTRWACFRSRAAPRCSRWCRPSRRTSPT